MHRLRRSASVKYLMFLCSIRHISFYAQAAYIRAIDDSWALRKPLVGFPFLFFCLVNRVAWMAWNRSMTM